MISWRLVGAAVTWPRGARAQQSIPVIGFLSSASPESDNIPADLIAFRKGWMSWAMSKARTWRSNTGGRKANTIDCRRLAADLVRPSVRDRLSRRRVAALRRQSGDLYYPDRVRAGTDPVQSGLVASLNRPGGNITGASLLQAELEAKRLELLHDLVPTTAVVGLLVNPANPAITEPETRKPPERSAPSRDSSHVVRASTPSEIETAFRTLVQPHASALLVSTDIFFTSQRDQIVALAAGRNARDLCMARVYRGRRIDELRADLDELTASDLHRQDSQR